MSSSETQKISSNYWTNPMQSLSMKPMFFFLDIFHKFLFIYDTFFKDSLKKTFLVFYKPI